jgi:hypothetical protein
MPMTCAYRVVIIDAFYYDDVDWTLDLASWKHVFGVIVSNVDCLKSGKYVEMRCVSKC